MLDRRLWRALVWRYVGRAAHGPPIGAVFIWSRGKDRGHVGIITGKTARGGVVLSGNDGNAVRERVRLVQRDSFQVAVMGESPTSGFAPLGGGRSGHCSAVDRFAAVRQSSLSSEAIALMHE
jgi:hypothetical protein